MCNLYVIWDDDYYYYKWNEYSFNQQQRQQSVQESDTELFKQKY